MAISSKAEVNQPDKILGYLCHSQSGEEGDKRRGDAIVQPALHVQSAADAHRDTLIGEDGQPESSIGWSQDSAYEQGKSDPFLGEDGKGQQTSQEDDQGQSQDYQPRLEAQRRTLSWCSSSVEESANNSRARVTSINIFTSSEVVEILNQPSPFAPVSAPTARKNMGMVIERRPNQTATAA